MHQPAELLLQVTNLTSISSHVQAWMGEFAAHSQGVAASTSSSGSASAAAHGSAALSPVQPAVSCHQRSGQGRAGSLCSQALSVQRRASSPQHKGPHSPTHTAQLSAAAVAARLSRTDTCGLLSCTADKSASIPAEALVATVNSIQQLASTQPPSSSALATLQLRGPFRTFAGNAMMAARQAAAAAAAALGPCSSGCAVQLHPAACELPAWGGCVIRLQAFNNLPGTFIDTLYVQVRHHPLFTSLNWG